MSRPKYDDACSSFSWASVLRELGWNDSQPINIGRTIIDRHATEHKVALYSVAQNGELSLSTYRRLERQSNKVANLLRSLGVKKGDRVSGVLSRRPETIAAMVGVWKAGGIYVPIFTGFAGEAVRTRVQSCKADVVFVHHDHRPRVGTPENVTVVTIAGDQGLGVERGDISFWQALRGQPDQFEAEPCSRRDAAIILYTSGSTGDPKGVEIAGNLLASVRPYVRFGLDLQATDTFWPTGDPGWGYGLVCYHAALSVGVPVLSYEGAPTPEVALELMQEHKVTNLATVPTLLRGIMALGSRKVAAYNLSLRAISSCGEPLNSEVVRFFQDAVGVTPADQFGSSENGLPLGNFNALDAEIIPGSMGLPMPGFDIAIVAEDGREVPNGTVGYLAQRPSEEGYYALRYWNDPERTANLFRQGWIIAGDLARRDDAGYFWFEGRSDDVIKSSGYRIGPFEVESAILHHPAIAEAGVVGKPDPLKGQIVAAYVTLKPGQTKTPDLVREIQDTARRLVGNHAYPREVEIVDSLPKTETGKIQRFKLRTPASVS
jgi:acetyl-CoA synthetase